MPAPLTDQIAEVDREIRQRERLYPRWIEQGRLKGDTADKKLADLRDAALTLRFLDKYAEPLRNMIKVLQQYNPYDDKVIPEQVMESLLKHPAVREVMAVFPEAVIAADRPLKQPAFDLFGDSAQPEPADEDGTMEYATP